MSIFKQSLVYNLFIVCRPATARNKMAVTEEVSFNSQGQGPIKGTD